MTTSILARLAIGVFRGTVALMDALVSQNYTIIMLALLKSPLSFFIVDLADGPGSA